MKCVVFASAVFCRGVNGTQLERGWHADGTRIERGWNAESVFGTYYLPQKGPGSLHLRADIHSR